MKNKEFDCVEFKRKVQEELWVEAGETFEGLIQLLNKKKSENTLLNDLLARKANKKATA